MKKYIFLAVSALTLASCQTDDFLGDTQAITQVMPKKPSASVVLPERFRVQN